MNATRWILPLITLLAACTKPTDYLYIHPEAQHRNTEVKIKEFSGTNQLDILWVIDNSRSMDAHQQDVINNMGQFIDSLAGANNTLDWKSGLVSTDIADDPYAGFEKGTELLSSDPQVATKFRNAVGRLGTMGDGYEKMFDPMAKALQNYPGFLRTGAAFAMIVISDAVEQSVKMNVTSFTNLVSGLKGGLNSVYFYGFLNPNDWCAPTDDPIGWNWSGSAFEAISKLIQGHVYKLCDPNFSDNLKDLGKNLGNQTTTPRFFLKEIPVPSTIQIFYKGRLLRGGLPTKGGLWTYNFNLNAIEFSDLSFAPGPNESVVIEYDVDNGTN